MTHEYFRGTLAALVLQTHGAEIAGEPIVLRDFLVCSMSLLSFLFISVLIVVCGRSPQIKRHNMESGM